MSEWMKTLLSLSLSGSLLAGLLFACRRRLAPRFSKRWRYYVWLVVVLRLLVPFSPAPGLVDRLFRGAEQAVTQAADTETGTGELPVLSHQDSPAGESALAERELLPAGPGDIADEAVPAASSQQPDWRALGGWIAARLWVVWAGVALVLLVRRVTLYQSFSRYLQAGWEPVSDPAVLDLLAAAGEQAGTRRPVELYTHSMLSSPVLMGVRRPCVVLPDAGLSAGELRNIFLHELIHRRRRDLLYKWLVQLAVCVHWFNPLVYPIAREIDRACELSCDEAVLATLGEEGRRPYGDTLLGALESGGRYREAVAAVTLHENAAQLKERLEEIMKFTKRSPRVVLAAVLAAVCLLASGVLLGSYAARPESAVAVVSERESTRPARSASDADAWSGTRQSAGTVMKTPDPDSGGSPAAVPNLEGGGISFPVEGITGVQLRPSVGKLTVRPGDGYAIRVGEQLRDRVSCRVVDGVLIYTDNYPNPLSISIGSWEGYEIEVTVPRDTQLSQFTLNGPVCVFDIQDIRADGVEIAAMNGSMANIASGGGMTVRSEAGSLTVRDCTAAGIMSITNEAGSSNLETLSAQRLGIVSEAGSLTLRGAVAAQDIIVINEAGSTELSGISGRAMSVLSEAGGVTLEDSVLSGDLSLANEAGSLKLTNVQAANLRLLVEVGGIEIRDSVFTGNLELLKEVGSAEITAQIGGDIRLGGGDAGSTKLTLLGAARSDYTIVAQNSYAGSDGYTRPEFEVDGTRYRYNQTLPGGNRTIEIHSVREVGTDVEIWFG